MPETVPVQPGIFTTENGFHHLIGGRCPSCARHHFPLSNICPYCSAEGVEKVLLSDHGTLWAWTAVTAPPPGYRGDVPFGFGAVELPERLRVITRLGQADPSKLRFGQEMALEIVTLHQEDGRTVVTWSFRPASAPSP